MDHPCKTLAWIGALAATAATLGCAGDEPTGAGGHDTTSGQGGTTTGGGGLGGSPAGGGGLGGGGSAACLVDCAQVPAPPCQHARCNDTTGQCDVVADDDGTSCEDGLFCTVDDVCQGGLCEPGPPMDCGLTPGVCEAIACDEDDQSCASQAAPNGTPCVDPDDLCLNNGSCDNGSCSGIVEDCLMQPAPDDCHVSVCNPQTGQCESVVGNEGGGCTDPNDPCTVNKTCVAGACQGGAAMDCSYLTQTCLLGLCDVNNGLCTTQPVTNGDPCDDHSPCTTGETCTNGSCGTATPVTQCIHGDGCCPAGCTVGTDTDCALPFDQPSYNAVITFANQPLQTRPCGLAWDGVSLWTGNLGSSSNDTEAQYTGTGTFVGYYQPAIDFRSLFTKGDGTGPLYARPYNSSQIVVQTTPGVFTNDVALIGTGPDGQSAVVWDDARSELVAHKDGTVRRWLASGIPVGTVTLIGYGTLNQEGDYPRDRNLAWAKGLYLTLSDTVLSAWDDQGNRIDTTVLTGTTGTDEEHFSLSYAQGKVWVVSANSSGTWLGYDVGL